MPCTDKKNQKLLKYFSPTGRLRRIQYIQPKEAEMATTRLHPMFLNTKGKLKDFVFYERNGVACIRARVRPRNTDTSVRRKNRRKFADAVKQWQAFTAEEKAVYKKKAYGKRVSGYNLFLSMYMKGRYGCD